MPKTKKHRKRARDRSLIKEKVEFFDPEAEKALEAARLALRRAQVANSRDGNAETYAALTEAEEAVEREQARYDDEIWSAMVVAIPRGRYVNLMAEHPPTEEQQQLLQEQLGGALDSASQLSNRLIRLPYNSDTFPRALLRETLQFDPPMTEEELEEELEAIFGNDSTWSQTDVQTLFDAAVSVCDKNTRLRR